MATGARATATRARGWFCIRGKSIGERAISNLRLRRQNPAKVLTPSSGYHAAAPAPQATTPCGPGAGSLLVGKLSVTMKRKQIRVLRCLTEKTLPLLSFGYFGECLTCLRRFTRPVSGATAHHAGIRQVDRLADNEVGPRIMDAGLKEAIALADRGAKRPLALEHLIDAVREYHRLAQADPAVASSFMNIARKTARGAASFLRPGGELRERLLAGEVISEEDWQRLVGPPLTPISA